jgi:predicted nucleic acid-binding protein
MARVGEALIVDASVVTKWHLKDEDHAEHARTILTGFMEGAVTLITRDYIRYEVSAATRGEKARISRDNGDKAIERFLALGIQTVGSSELIVSAYDIMHQYGCGFSDALYLALARDLNLPLITADLRLYQRIQTLPNVVWLGDYTPVGRN